MQHGKVSQAVLASGSELHQCPPSVGWVDVTGNETICLGPIDQLDRRVQLELEHVGQGGERWVAVPGMALHRKQKLVLRRGEAGVAGRLFGEAQEGAQGMTKLRECPVIGSREWRSGRSPGHSVAPLAGSPGPLGSPSGGWLLLARVLVTTFAIGRRSIVGQHELVQAHLVGCEFGR